MAKLTLQDITGSYASVAKLNANFTAIEDALENTVSRDGTAPNSWSADMDANGQTIINMADATALQSPVTLGQVQSIISANAEGLIAVLTEGATASAGQTVFNLSTFSYLPAANNLFVFRNGAKLRLTSDYVEASATSITLTSGANEGDVFEFVSNASTTTVDFTASNILIVDAANYFTSNTVEGALQEIGLGLFTIADVGVVNGIIKGDGSNSFSAAVAGTDYLAPAAIGVTVQGYDVDTAKLDVAQSWTANQTPNGALASVSTTSDFTFTGDAQVKQVTFTNAITVTFAAPTGVTENCFYVFKLKAGDTSARTFAWNSAYKFPAAASPLTSGTTTNGAFDIITFVGGASNTLQYIGHQVDVR